MPEVSATFIPFRQNESSVPFTFLIYIQLLSKESNGPVADEKWQYKKTITNAQDKVVHQL